MTPAQQAAVQVSHRRLIAGSLRAVAIGFGLTAVGSTGIVHFLAFLVTWGVVEAIIVVERRRTYVEVRADEVPAVKAALHYWTGGDIAVETRRGP